MYYNCFSLYIATFIAKLFHIQELSKLFARVLAFWAFVKMSIHLELIQFKKQSTLLYHTPIYKTPRFWIYPKIFERCVVVYYLCWSRRLTWRDRDSRTWIWSPCPDEGQGWSLSSPDSSPCSNESDGRTNLLT